MKSPTDDGSCPADESPFGGGSTSQSEEDIKDGNEYDFGDEEYYWAQPGDLREDCGDVRDMSMILRLVSVYDCESEEAAHNISKMCHNESNVNFGDIGSNSATYHSRSTINDSDIIKMIDTWWKSSTQPKPLTVRTPTENDTPMIPFLQVGCDGVFSDLEFDDNYSYQLII
ncbi:hypothetical protein KIN20_030075 [Parelaphostrongylus tenuis]|uniref:Uncharacterized protein n=1 Tax=Parelaphostrongylus tenuis TaxID=148309 RepID=A0AAD5R3B8_PARTN|nr:hypothetical protein KIN20_030075 [Parelaphostrongylus tenuis]